MYQINDYIVAGNMGICKVCDICIPDFSKDEQLCYVLQPASGMGDTIYVPTSNEKLTMRKIISREEANHYILQLPAIQAVWYDNDKMRDAEYKSAIKSGDCKKWIQMIKGLYTKKQERSEKGKKLSQTDERNFRKAEGLLMEEFALALSLPLEEVFAYIEGKLGMAQ